MKYLFVVLCHFISIVAFSQKNLKDTTEIGDTAINITETITYDVELRFINGQVKDAKTGLGIPGASINIKGTNKVTSTDQSGHFNLNIDHGDKLIISMAGYSSIEMDAGQTNIAIGGIKIEAQQSLYHSEKSETRTTSLNIFPVPYPRPSAIYSFPPNIFSNIQLLYQVDFILKRGLDGCGYDEKRYYYIPHGFALVTQMEQIYDDGSSRKPPERWSSKIAMDLNNPWEYIKALFSTSTGFYRVLVFLVTDIDHSAGRNYISEAEARKWLNNGYSSLPLGIRNDRMTNNYNCTVLIYHYKKQPGEEAKQIFSDPLTGKMHYVKSKLSEYIK